MSWLPHPVRRAIDDYVAQVGREAAIIDALWTCQYLVFAALALLGFAILTEG